MYLEQTFTVFNIWVNICELWSGISLPWKNITGKKKENADYNSDGMSSLNNQNHVENYPTGIL